MESFMVIKVKYGETLRRFNARVADDKLALSMAGLRDKIFQLFKFPPDAEVTLTYIDEDADVVTLVDDEDLQDVTRQGLDPLRIFVSLKTKKIRKPSATSSGKSTPLKSPQVQPTSPNMSSSGSDLLKSLPESKREKMIQHSADMASTAREIAELSRALKRMGLSSLKKASVAQPGSKSDPQGPAPVKTVGAIKTILGPSVDEPTSQAVPSVNSGDPSLKQNKPSPSPNAEKRTDDAGQTENCTGYLDGSNLNSSLPDLNETPCESSSKDPKPNTSVVDGKRKVGKKFGDCHLVRKALDISYSSALPAGPEKAAENQLREIIAEPVNVGGFAVISVSGPVVKDAITPQSSAYEIPFKKNHDHCDGISTIFHRGIRCDGCGVHPITGPRFKSKVKDDYDLCIKCFDLAGNDADYIRMDRPVTYIHPLPPPFRSPYVPHGCFRGPTAAQVFQGFGVKPSGTKLDRRFVEDVNVLDGTIMAPLTPFTKIWRMRNNGNIVWPQGTQLVWIGGERLTNAFSVELPITSVGLAVDQELDVVVDFTAPELPGKYISYWRMSSPSGQKFGQRVWVLIQVDASVNLPKKEELFDEASQDLNLNFPPASSGVAGPETINSNPEPIVGNIIPEPKISNPTMELVEPVVDGNPEEESKSNINRSLLTGVGDKSSISPSAPGSSISCPIDLTEEAPAVTSDALPSLTEMQASSQDVTGNSEVETTLLKELEEMGFKQVELNKKVLRKNEYDLELSVDDLCGVSDWDPILEELAEMGFCDKEMNKKLLDKNNGSIKGVVMDLIAEEN